MPRAKPRRKTVVLAATVCAGVLAVVLAITAFSGGGASGVSYLDGNTNAVYYQPGHQHLAPDFSGTTLTGQPLRFTSYRGKVVVLNFWGSWCGPCRSEAATLTVAANQYQRSGVEFLGVDIQDNVASASAFVRQHAIGYPIVSDPNDLVPLAFGSSVPIAATPTTLVIAASGHVVGAVFGEVTYAELSTLLGKATAR